MTRFKELRKKAGLTQEALINQFNIEYGRKYTPAAISQFENGRRIPETNALIDFANFFGVSVDYLLGVDAVGSFPEDISVEEIALVRAYRQAPEHITKAIHSMLEPYKVRYVAEIANEKVAEKME
jgi:transcriptional regulator with XRE-family HTH domain